MSNVAKDDPEALDRYYLDLKGARERLCRAQTTADPVDSATLQGAIDRIDLVATDLLQWSRYDGAHRDLLTSRNAG